MKARRRKRTAPVEKIRPGEENGYKLAIAVLELVENVAISSGIPAIRIVVGFRNCLQDALDNGEGSGVGKRLREYLKVEK